MDNENPGQKKLHARFRRAVPRLFAVALLAMAAIVLLNLLMKTPGGPDQFGLNAFETMDDGWQTEDGTPFEIAEIDDLRTEGSDTVSIYHRLPTEIGKGESIVFRSKNCTVDVLLDGEEIYVSDVAEAPFYNHSPGTRWNLVTLREEDAGKLVELRVTQAYEDGRAKVDNFYYGDRAAIVLHQLDAKLGGAVISLLIFFVALVFVCAWLVLNWHRKPKDYSLFWLAAFAMAAACWCLLETNVLQFFVRDLRLIQLLDNMMLVVGGMALYLYLDSVYGVFRSRAVRVLCAVDLAYILLATLSQFLGFWDYHQTLNGAVATYGIVVVILVVSLLKRGRTKDALTTKSDRVFFTFQQIGILLLGVGLLGDLVRYLMMDVLDRAFIIRIGLLCFIICFGAGNIYQMILLVKKGMEAEFISQLAYSDGLTKTGNRTAYLEQLQRLAAEHAGEGLGLAMFDVNNLKRVNDTFGHKSGDELLLTCADILEKAFGADWSVYRIGGDEFVALSHGGGVHGAYEAAAERFAQAVAQANADSEREQPVAIAHGVAFRDTITPETIEAAEKEADLNMYRDKYRLKCLEE